VILVGAGFITKILGFVYRIALSRIIGDEGMGLFQMAFPILIFTIVITTGGIPVAISKLVAEAEAKREEWRIRTILIVSILIVTVMSILITTLVLIFAPLIANTLLTYGRAIYSLLGIASIIPIIAISSIFRGYFQGRQNMSPYALSTILEQTVRIFTVIILAQHLLPYGIEYASAGAMIGMVLGELIGMLFLVYSFRKDPRRPLLKLFQKRKIRTSLTQFIKTTKDLLHIAIPVTASRVVGSLSYAVEPIVVSQSLAIAGIAVATSTALYGQLEGMALPLVFFPAFITYALSVSLVPAISEAAAQNNKRLVEHRLQQTIRLCLIIGAPCIVLIFVLAEPLSVLLYHQKDVGRLMQIMAPFAILFYLQGPLAAILQGLDEAHVAMRNSIIGAIIKTALIFILGSRAEYGIDGVVMAINCGIIIVTVLHLLTIIKIISFTIKLGELLRIVFTILFIMMLSQHLYTVLDSTPVFRIIYTIIGCLTSYLVCICCFSLLKKEDIRRVPYIGKWFTFFLRS
jgi:stage V sporulation protein B